MKEKMKFILDKINIVCKFYDNHPNVKNDLNIATKNEKNGECRMTPGNNPIKNLNCLAKNFSFLWS